MGGEKKNKKGFGWGRKNGQRCTSNGHSHNIIELNGPFNKKIPIVKSCITLKIDHKMPQKLRNL